MNFQKRRRWRCRVLKKKVHRVHIETVGANPTKSEPAGLFGGDSKVARGRRRQRFPSVPGNVYLGDLDHISPPQNAPTHPSTLSLVGSASVTLLT
jgi:hypothetical protein